MKIRNRIAIQFTIIVTCLLIASSLLIYSESSSYREEEFFDRLSKKARTTGLLLSHVNEINANLLKIIDNNTFSAMKDEIVIVYNNANEVIYSSSDHAQTKYEYGLLHKIRGVRSIETYQGLNQVVGILYDDGPNEIIVIASAYDQFGYNKLSNLRNTLIWCLIIGTLLTIFLSIYFAGNSLKPISKLNTEIGTINALNLNQRLTATSSPDEIGQLTDNFNTVLEKLELAFRQQRSFISHASHELRTPLAALKSEVQLALLQKNISDETHETFHNLSGDIERLVEITNNLLFLARSFEDLTHLRMSPIQLDEVLFSVKENIQIAHPNYQVIIDYAHIPSSQNDTTILGNSELLKRVFYNLIENGCKYSEDQKSKVTVITNHTFCLIEITDNGIGIPPDEIPFIFAPFFRSKNAIDKKGHGIGLSICKHVLDAHKVPIQVASSLSKGTKFTLKFTHL